MKLTGFWFESDWYFCNITKSGWFWKRLSRKKVLTNHFLKSLQKQAYTDVLQNRFFRNFSIFTGKHLCWSLFLIKLQAYFNTCFLVNIAKCFDSKSPVASVDLLFLIKSNVGWFLLKMVDLLIVRVIYTLVETIQTRFYWSTCTSQKLVQSKPLQQRLFVLILAFLQCRQAFVHYLMSIILICKVPRGFIK